MRYPIPVLILFSLLQGLPLIDAADSAPLRIATFSVDITPQPGQPVGLGFIPVLKTVEHPLLARGILLQDAGVSCVICTLDWMEVHNESYDLLRHSIATAAGVSESNVALHCLHQHTAPAISTAAQRLQLQKTALRRIASTDYLINVSGKISRAIQACRTDWRPVTHVGTGQARVDRVASSRRIERADGSIQGRGSNTATSPELRTLEEGLIDPWVRTVTLENDGGPVAQLHYYASHPQSFYGDGRASYDVPGIIRDRLEHASGVFQLYLTGCGGDVAFGKYNDGSKQARDQLVERLLAGIRQSLASVKQYPVKPLQWQVTPVHFPLRTDPEFSGEASRKILMDPQAGESQRRKAAITVAWIERVQSRRPVELSCLSIGDVRMLHLPGEPFVQFQIAAQNMRPDQFICVAGYGDCGMGYLGGDRIFTDRGGYEQTYSFAGPSETLLLAAIQTLLKTPDPKTSSRDNHLPRYVANRADSDIRVDGRLDETAWKNASVFENFRFAWWKQGQREQTVARMVWDDRFLYVSYECADAHISATQTERDSPVYEDDCVELFAAPNPLRPNDYFNIEMNVNRSILDQHHPRGPGNSQTQNWNAVGIQIATTVDGTLNQDTDIDRGWVLEVAIPFSNFAAVTGTPQPRDGDIWHLNLNRLGGKTNPQYSQWSPGNT
ncbi:MAG: carbohydrate-binding family 9-like protein, partial [Planctomycetaceae bacterium]